MQVDHSDIALAAFIETNLPSPPRSIEDAFRYIENLLSKLPIIEKAGYVKGPVGGENVIQLPNGDFVRISRVMYPDGDIYKVMNDAPNGSSQWVYEDHRPELYIPYEGEYDPGDPGNGDPGDDELEKRVAELEFLYEEQQRQIEANRIRMEAINTRMEVLDSGNVKEPLPDYVGSVTYPIFGTRVITSKPKH